MVLNWVWEGNAQYLLEKKAVYPPQRRAWAKTCLGMREYGMWGTIKRLNQYVIVLLRQQVCFMLRIRYNKRKKILNFGKWMHLCFFKNLSVSVLIILYLGIILHDYKSYNQYLYTCSSADCTETLYWKLITIFRKCLHSKSYSLNRVFNSVLLNVSYDNQLLI